MSEGRSAQLFLVEYCVHFFRFSQPQPQNFIPYIGPLVAGYDNQSSAVTFTFDQRNVLTGTTSTQTGMATGANLAAGGNAATRPYEAVRN